MNDLFLNEFNIARTKMESDIPQIDLITDLNTIVHDFKISDIRNTLFYILIEHIREKNGYDSNYRFPVNYQFIKMLTDKTRLEDYIIEILQKVYTREVDYKVAESMHNKITPNQLTFHEEDNEFFKLSIFKRLTYGNKKLILESALALQATYLTSGTNQNNGYLAIRTLKNYKNTPYNNQITKELVNAYQRLKNQDNIFYKHNHYHIIDMENLIERYSKYICLIAGYSTSVKMANDNWEFDENDYILNRSLSSFKYDVYALYPKDANNENLGFLNLKEGRDIKVEIGNIKEIDTNTYNDLIEYETKRWDYNNYVRETRHR